MTFRIYIAFLFFIPALLFAQESKRVEILQANSLEGSKVNGIEVRRLVGDVVFKQDNTLMYCDSALFYESTNSIDAFGRIRITGPDANMTGKALYYDGNTKQAIITDDVQLTDGKMTLTTKTLNYNTGSDVAEYHTPGKVVDNENVLTSKHGYYFAKEKKVFFKGDVVLTNPKYIMNADTLMYHTPTATSYFYGPCTITSTGKDHSYIYCEYGWYNTKTEKSYFSKNAFIESSENRLKGDSILYDRQHGVGRAFNNVDVTDTIQKIIISGDYAYLNEQTHRSLVTGKTLMTKIFAKDSMYLHADTLYALEDTVSKQKTYFAYNHVRIYKTDLQGKCDSLVYTTADTTIRFYNSPVLWNNNNQLTADSVSLILANDQLHSMFLQLNSFIVSKEDTVRFNQVKGRDMTGYFTNNELYRIKVTGNGQTVYHIRNKKKQITGVNRAECSDMEIAIMESRVNRITLLNKPDATLYPVKQTNPKEMELKGFNWYEWIRPVSKEDVFLWR